MTGIPQTSSAAGDRDALERLEQFGGPALAERMVQLFLAETPRRIEAASTALASGDILGVKRLAHMLRSSCGQLGAPAMQAVTFQMESSENRDALTGHIEQLRAEFTRYTAWLAGRTSSDKEPQ